MEPNSIVIVSLHTPKEKLWGSLVSMNASGVTVRGIDLNSFDDFIRQVMDPEGERIGLPTLFFPMQRIERIALDEPHGSIPSLSGAIRAARGPLHCAIISRYSCKLESNPTKWPPASSPSRISSRSCASDFCRFLLFPFITAGTTWRLAILIIAGLTDGLDGLLARSLNQKTALGAYLDPIADKLLLSSSFVVLALNRKISWWLATLVLSRDIILSESAAVILVVVGLPAVSAEHLRQSSHGAANPAGVCGGACWRSRIGVGCEYSRNIIGYLVAGFTVFSGFHYCFTVARRMNEQPRK